MLIRARAPLRIGLAGGGTDLSSYSDLYGGYVLNATISKHAYAIIRKTKKNEVLFHAKDFNFHEVYALDEVTTSETKLSLHRAVYNRMMAEFNDGVVIPLELITYCDAPVGSGLGASSTLVVAMIRAFVELLNLPLDDYKIAKLAYSIERIECGLNGGKQDQYSATFGGFNFMEFQKDQGVVVNPLRIKNWIICELEASLMLYYTGVSRESAKIIDNQVNKIQDGKASNLTAMHKLKEEAVSMKEALLRGDFSALVDSMAASWENKKKTADLVSNVDIDEIYNSAINAGALSGKISGAGGGGFMMFFVPPEKRIFVVRSLEKFSGYATNCYFTKEGAQAWKIV